MLPSIDSLRSIRAAVLCGLCLALSAPTSVDAQIWTETGDAGDLVGTAQATGGVGALQQIFGSFAGPDDADMYCVRIDDPLAFQAGIQCLAMVDPDIWLFDGSALGRTHHDTCSGGQTAITGAFVPVAGTYYLAVAYGGRQAQSPAGAIWLTQVFATTERAPDGPGAPGPLVAWAGFAAPTSLVNYQINLQGASFCDVPVTIDRETWGLVKSTYR